MKLNELEQVWEVTFPPPPESTVDMRRVLCLCHYKMVWVSRHEPLPYWCPIKELHAPLAE